MLLCYNIIAFRQTPNGICDVKSALPSKQRAHHSDTHGDTTAKVLPLPQLRIRINDVDFSVYRAKRLTKTTWVNDTLQQIVRTARRSYRRYGHIPYIDNYDRNATVYIASASFKRGLGKNSPICTEWLSIRALPGLDYPDFDDYLLKKEPLDRVLNRELFNGQPNWKARIIGLSRMCGVPPRAKGAIRGRAKLSHTGTLFALLNQCILKDRDVLRGQPQYVTGLFRPELVLRRLVREDTGGTLVPTFTPADVTLGTTPQTLRINRKKTGLYAYQYAGYFLNSQALKQTLRSLADEGALSREILPISAGRAYLSFAELRRLKPLLTAMGPTPGAAITGEKLRRAIDRRVPDGPTLYLMPINEWKAGISQYLELLRKPHPLPCKE